MQRSRNRLPSAFFVVCLGLALTIGTSVAGEDQTAFVKDSDTGVAFIRRNSKLLLHSHDVAKAFGWKAEIVSNGQMLTLCREGENRICIPLRLSDANSNQTDAGLFVDAQELARLLKFRALDVGGVVTLIPDTRSSAGEQKTPAYNAAWGKGRGFKVGQTLPDIPLVDLEGREVRFSRFLGKQYIIYCWASW